MKKKPTAIWGIILVTSYFLSKIRKNKQIKVGKAKTFGNFLRFCREKMPDNVEPLVQAAFSKKTGRPPYLKAF